ncbi:hypothetical protein AGMMS50230_07430 [Spirochaetia bacterium]|nr:hypothetical protein AGMMS50230_07430 [Spirochaetia bacterium]
MTVAQRNWYFKGAVILSFLCLVVLAFLSRRLIPLYPELQELSFHRSQGGLQSLGRFFAMAPLAPFAAVGLSVVYAFVVSVLIARFFEKTPCPEILFVDLFSLSFIFEIIGIMAPLRSLYPFPSELLIVGTRLLIFGRFFGVLSLFASSVYAAGLDMQKQGQVIIAMVIAILVVALRIPVNSQSWDSSLVMFSGYSSMFRFAESALMLITVVSFLVAAYSRGTGEYLFAALGAFLTFLGRSFLIGSDTWFTLVSGTILLAAGTWFITVRLHRVYLWL